MKTLRILFAAVLSLLALPALAQTVGPIAITSNQCASISVSPSAAVIGVEVVGTWTGTLQPKGTIQGQTAFNVQVTPSSSTTAQATITANGGFFALVAGYTTFQLCGNTVATGTAKVFLNVSQATAGSGAGAPPAAAQVIQSGLMADYEMPVSEVSTTVLTDYSGNNNNGTFPGGGANPTRIAITGGLSFVGSSLQNVALPAALNSAITIMLAYKFQVNGAYGASGFVAALNGNNAGAQIGLEFISSSGTSFDAGAAGLSRVSTAIWNAAPNGFASTFSRNNPQGSHVVTIALDTVDHIYYDGTEAVSYPNGQNVTVGHQTLGNYQLGGSAVNTSWYTGQIYGAWFYNRVLSAAEIAQNSAIITNLMKSRGIAFPVTGGPNASATQLPDNFVFDGDSIPNLGWEQFITPTNAASVWTTAVGASQLVTVLLPNTINADGYYVQGASRNAYVIHAGTNDLYLSSLTAGATHAAMANYCRLRRMQGYKVFVATMISRNSDTNKNAYNALIRQHWSEYADGLFDYASDPFLGCDGCSANTLYFNGDGIHPIEAGQEKMLEIAQRGLNRFYGAQDFTTATVYVAAAPAATTVTATSDSSSCPGLANGVPCSTATYTFGSNPFPVGAFVTCTGITPAGYNTTFEALTSTATQVTGSIASQGLGVGTVFGSCSTSLMKDSDRFTVLNFGAGNFTLQSCIGYTAQRISLKNINAAGSTIAAFGSELIDGAATLAIAQNQVRILEVQLVTPSTPVCSWKVIQ